MKEEKIKHYKQRYVSWPTIMIVINTDKTIIHMFYNEMAKDKETYR